MWCEDFRQLVKISPSTPFICWRSEDSTTALVLQWNISLIELREIHSTLVLSSIWVPRPFIPTANRPIWWVDLVLNSPTCNFNAFNLCTLIHLLMYRSRSRLSLIHPPLHLAYSALHPSTYLLRSPASLVTQNFWTSKGWLILLWAIRTFDNEVSSASLFSRASRNADSHQLRPQLSSNFNEVFTSTCS